MRFAEIKESVTKYRRLTTQRCSQELRVLANDCLAAGNRWWFLACWHAVRQARYSNCPLADSIVVAHECFEHLWPAPVLDRAVEAAVCLDLLREMAAYPAAETIPGECFHRIASERHLSVALVKDQYHELRHTPVRAGTEADPQPEVTWVAGTFSGLWREAPWSTFVQVLLVEKSVNEGSMAKLTMELIPRGTGCLYANANHRCGAFDEDFLRAFEHAKAWLRDEKKIWPDSADIRWSLTLRSGDKVKMPSRFEGKSVGLIVAMGLARLLRIADYIPKAHPLWAPLASDLTRVGGLAAIDGGGRLSGVGGVFSKFLGARDRSQPAIDMIVASTEQARALKEEFESLRKNDRLEGIQFLYAESIESAIEQVHTEQCARSARKSPPTPDQRNRLQLLGRVRNDWINGFLNVSLYEVARIELGLHTKSDAVEQPWKATVQTPDQPATRIPAGAKISDVFDKHDKALLILGAPGTGKTTLLLELAKQLLDRAGEDENHPIPVVFNLSTWAEHRPPLSEWMEAEFERYGVRKEDAKRWIETDQIIPLLDGLDEVAADHLESCVEEINDFRRDHGLLPIAVCSRIADYEAVGTKLRLRSAVVVQLLTRLEVETYLEKAGDSLRGLRTALNSDASLWELFETPLMLWVAMLAYRDVTPDFSLSDTIELRRQQLWATFVEAMFERRAVEVHFDPRRIVSGLRWLALALHKKNQTTLYLEDLDTYCTSPGLIQAVIATSQLISTFAFALLFAVVIGIIRVIQGGSILGGIGTGLLFGAVVGQVGEQFSPMLHLRPVQIKTNMLNIGGRIRKGVSLGLTVGSTAAVLAFGNLGGFLSDSHATFSALAVSLLLGLIVMLLVTAAMMWLVGDAHEIEQYVRPNQGTSRSLQSALTVALIVGLTISILFRVVMKTSVGSGITASILGGDAWMYIGLFSGAMAGLFSGGLFVIKHWAARQALAGMQVAPLRYVRFLDCATERLFLRRVGGGYIFIHRMLLEYFASSPEHPDSK